MGAYYLHNGVTLLQRGHCPDGQEDLQERDGLFVGIGDPPESLTFPDPPEQTYVDLRVAAYPPLADLADALYWQAHGDATKVVEYFAKVEAVKQAIPKTMTA